MTDENTKPRRELRWGVIASVLVHVVIAVVLLVQLPITSPEPVEEESVSVELVPPPEPEPEPPAAEQPGEKQAAQAEQPAVEEAQAPEAEQPPPPPEPPATPEEKPPEPEAPQQQASEEEGQPMQVLRPVFEFGEEDAGPRRSEDGNASQAQATPTETPPDQPLPESETPPPETAAAEEPQSTAEAPANPVPDDIALPETSADALPLPPDGPAAGQPDAPTVVMDEATPIPTPTPRPENPAPAAQSPPRTLFSQRDTGGEVATTGIGNLSRGIRAGQLCATELREQLRHGPRGFRPEILPSYRLQEGTVMDVPQAAFRAGGQWYNVSFRCEINEGATNVASFSLNVGDPIPRSQWRSRGLPD